MVQDVIWDTAEYFEKAGEVRGEKIGEERMLGKFIVYFKNKGLSEEEIQSILKEVGVSLK